jgi:hypothetical protein
MTEKQEDKLHQLNFIIWFTVALLTGLGLFANLIYYLINR